MTVETLPTPVDETAQHATAGRVARMRADALRAQAALLTQETLEPLRVALRRRAAELELAAEVLAPVRLAATA